eukprot:TRINITY_DN11067_c0_g1_i1.p1 TRINITY_DN11067_c0_g1~~TRINITY_DN11067_c0_g1_i1.p1  ORF type:complete len:322 (+),score=46.16 TRINITY_DN11067_c0_g1_i1:162-1127(+)
MQLVLKPRAGGLDDHVIQTVAEAARTAIARIESLRVIASGWAEVIFTGTAAGVHPALRDPVLRKLAPVAMQVLEIELPSVRITSPPPDAALSAAEAEAALVQQSSQLTPRALGADQSNKRAKVEKESRGAQFVKFLVDVFGLEFLGEGDGVLDVAGGSGQVSFELAFWRSVRCTCVDPRAIKLCRKQRRAAESAPGGFRLGYDLEAKAPLSSLQEWFDDEFVHKYSRLWERCSAVVGMHPDEATDPIVDMALKAHKPFAVVPCCVFPHTNTHRRLRDGSSVRSYQEYCRFLMEKDPGIRSVRLPFDGRNLCIYLDPRNPGP